MPLSYGLKKWISLHKALSQSVFLTYCHLFFKMSSFFKFMCMHVCLCVGMWVDICREAIRGVRFPGARVNRQLWATRCGYWELSLDPLEKQGMFLTPQPSLYFLVAFVLFGFLFIAIFELVFFAVTRLTSNSDLPASASRALESKVCAATTWPLASI